MTVVHADSYTLATVRTDGVREYIHGFRTETGRRGVGDLLGRRHFFQDRTDAAPASPSVNAVGIFESNNIREFNRPYDRRRRQQPVV